MGEYADMIIEGFIDSVTGEVLDGDSPGYPRSRVRSNAASQPKVKQAQQKNTKCKLCQRTFAHGRALDEHSVVVHGSEPATKAIRKLVAAGKIKKAEGSQS